MATAVFLFTDIEGSTRRWSADASAMRTALSIHDGVLNDAVRAAGGVVFKHTGDGMLAWFPTGSSALEGAAACQRALQGVDWATLATSLRVRMAVHAGDAEPRGDDWFGPALNRCARLLGLGHGGQVLLSDAVRALCVDSLPSGFGLVDLGLHQLRDLQEPERVWQLAAERLETSFPMLRSTDALPGNVPAPLTPFIGRSRELADVVDALAAHRMVTIVGPGGMGKTRLAVEVAEAVAHRFPGGVWVVELASVERAEGVAHALLGALGVQPGLGLGAVQLVARFLAGRRAMLVMDNCEHLTETVAHIVDELLRAAPEMNVLATSRRPVGSIIEQVRTLGPLDPQDQVLLFTTSAAATGQAREVDAGLVGEVCRELDGMPLAIELAAARLRSMTLAELAHRLPQRFRLLSGGRSIDPRHRSLEALVAWSFEQLSAREQMLFAQLSVFLAEFDLEAAHAVAGAPGTDDLDTLTGLDVLVERSLLIATDRHGRTRYSMLETLRQYGEQHLPDADATRARHAAHFTSVIARFKTHTSGGRGAFGELILDDFPNIRAAFQFALIAGDHDQCLSIVSELAPYAQLRPTLEVAEWVDAALLAAAGSVSTQKVRAHLAAAGIRHYLADWAAAEHHARQAMALDAEIGGAHTASAFICLAPPIAYQGRVHEALAAADQGVADAERADRPVVLAAARAVRLHCAIYAGLTPTEDDLSIMRERAEQAKSPVVRTYAVCNLGLAALMRGHPDAATWLEEGCAQARAINHLHMACLHRTYLALARADAGPTSALIALRVALIEYGAARIPFGPRQVAAELLHHFADLGSWESVATLHGATPPVSLYPEVADRARAAARAELGAPAFERCAARGHELLHEEFEAFVHAQLDDLCVPQHQLR